MSDSELTFKDLQTHVAVQLGVAWYGSAGDEIAQPPTDTPTLDRIKGYVNGGLRMFLMDAPPDGWRMQQPVANTVVWATVTTGAITVTTGTTLTSASADFYPSMVGHAIVADTSGNTYYITGYSSSTVITVHVNATGETGDTFTITADGNYTLPSDFGGEYSGDISYTAGANPGASINWSNEGTIRKLRENASSQTGYPTLATIRKMDNSHIPRRWELLVYATPDDDYTLQFPYELHFTQLDGDSDLHPFSVQYDEGIKAACEAYAELHGEDMLEGRTQYYQQKVLPACYRINRRSAPRRLGTLKTGRRDMWNFREYRERPDVTVS